MNVDALSNEQLVAWLYTAAHRLYVAVTGGGVTLMPLLFSRPGASQVMAGASIPYETEALYRFLCRPVASAVCAATAEAMALRAREQANLTAAGSEPLGFGCTAALATSRVRRGAEQAFLCAATQDARRFVHLRFEKGRTTRDEQEQILARTCLLLLAAVCTGRSLHRIPAADGVAVTLWEELVAEPLRTLYGGACRWVTVQADGRQRAGGDVKATALLPGSFNPLHRGHIAMSETAAQLLGGPVALELATFNADKSEVSLPDLRRRMRAMQGRCGLVVTRAATFIEKARLFPGMTWVLGVDTAKRVVDPKYYGGEANRDRVFDEFIALRSAFLVMGRSEAGLFRTLDHVALPAKARALFRAVPEERFRADLSSTEIRTRAAQCSPRP